MLSSARSDIKTGTTSTFDAIFNFSVFHLAWTKRIFIPETADRTLLLADKDQFCTVNVQFYVPLAPCMCIDVNTHLPELFTNKTWLGRKHDLTNMVPIVFIVYSFILKACATYIIYPFVNTPLNTASSRSTYIRRCLLLHTLSGIV